MRAAAGTLKNITLETGGKSSLLVFPDADLDQAVKRSHFGIMSNQGQICTATSRIFVHDAVLQPFLTRFKEAIQTTSKMDHQWDPSAFHGPQVTRPQYERILSCIEIAKREGAEVLSGGGPHAAEGKNRDVYFTQPTGFTGVTDSMRIAREEVFCPVVVILPFSSEDEAVRRANDSTYGLGAAVSPATWKEHIAWPQRSSQAWYISIVARTVIPGFHLGSKAERDWTGIG